MSLQREISEWADATFGRSSSPLRIAVRANEELAQLLRAIVCEEEPAKIAEEAADVAIVLYRLADVMEFEEERFAIGRASEPRALYPLALQSALAAQLALYETMSALVDYPRLHDPGRARVRESLWQALWCLYVTSERVGLSLQDAIAAKMTVNRTRDWKLDGTGHGYHL